MNVKLPVRETASRTYGNLDNNAFVTLLYRNVLERTPDSGGFNFWTGELNSGRMTRGQAMLGFSESAEFRARIHNSVYVTTMYVGMLKRAPEPAGFHAPEYRQRFLP